MQYKKQLQTYRNVSWILESIDIFLTRLGRKWQNQHNTSKKVIKWDDTSMAYIAGK